MTTQPVPRAALPRALTPKGLLVTMPIGAAIGLGLDRVHVISGVLEYRDPVLAGQAWWVPFLFAIAAPLVLLNDYVPRLVLGAKAGVPVRDVEAEAGWFIAAYLATALFWQWPWLLAAGLAGVWLVRSRRYLRPDRLAAAVGLAVTGPIFEATLASTGGFWYITPDFFGVPLWLAPLYLYVADLAAALVDWLEGVLASPSVG
ncbi:MAG: hypothetical protein V4850_22425 [Myxococcota bacterium]